MELSVFRSRAGALLKSARVKAAILFTAGAGLVSNVSAATINWTAITDILDGVGTYMLPSLMNLVMAAVPFIIVMSVVGFIVMFMDKIIALFKI